MIIGDGALRIEFAPALMTREIAAYYLSCSLREIDALREPKKITPVGEGRRVRYRKSDLDQVVEDMAERPSSRGA